MLSFSVSAAADFIGSKVPGFFVSACRLIGGDACGPGASALIIVLACMACSNSEGTDEHVDLEGASLLLITLDTTRADALGCYGGPDWITPNLDRLAREGVRFEQARTVTPITLPSHATILTGLYPFEHGIRDNGTFQLPDKIETITERLKRAGYTTHAITGAFVLHSSFGLDQGFDKYIDVPRIKLSLGGSEDQRTAGEVVDEALRALKEAGADQPVFLWVHFFDPHFPYEPPPVYMQQALKGLSSATKNSRQRCLYHGEVAYMDNEIGRLIEGLQDAQPDRGWLIAAVADHGEGLGDHDEDTHAFLLYDTTVRVPMILHHNSLPEGKVVSEPVSVSDLAPTLMRLLGIPFEKAAGTDLTPYFSATDQGPEASLLYFETARPYYNYNWSPLFGIVENGYKLIDGPDPQLYDPFADAAEREDLAARFPEKVKSLRGKFGPLGKRVREQKRFVLSREDQSRIVALGYAGPATSSETALPLLPGKRFAGLLDPAKGLRDMKLCNEALELAMRPSEADRKNAVSLIRDALRKDPNNPTYLAHAATVYFRAGFTARPSGLRSNRLKNWRWRTYASCSPPATSSLAALMRLSLF